MVFPRWEGVFPAVTTPFKPDYSLDLDLFASQVSWQLAAGVHGIIVSGSLGEASTLESDEKLELVKSASQVSAGKAPVLVCVSESSTLRACRFAEAAANAKADGLMVLPPLNYKADPKETINHFRAIADACDLPIMVYNNPVSYGIDVTPDQFQEMADNPQFVAIKESSDDIRRITDLFNAVGNRYQIFSGVDNLGMESVLMGAHGWVAGLVCAYPRETVAIYNLVLNGRLEEARQLYRWFMPLLHLDVHAKLVQNIKLAQEFVGQGNDTVRPPRAPLEGAERAGVMETLNRAKAAYENVSWILDLEDAKEVRHEGQLC